MSLPFYGLLEASCSGYILRTFHKKTGISTGAKFSCVRKLTKIFTIVYRTLLSGRHRKHDPVQYSHKYSFLDQDLNGNNRKRFNKKNCKKKVLFFNPESEFIKFEPRLKSPKTRFQLSADLNIETLNTILSGTNHI